MARREWKRSNKLHGASRLESLPVNAAWDRRGEEQADTGKASPGVPPGALHPAPTVQTAGRSGSGGDPVPKVGADGPPEESNEAARRRRGGAVELVNDEVLSG